MSRHAIRCDFIPGPALDRRSVVLGLAGLAALGPAAAARAAIAGPSLADLVAADGSASALARTLTGTEVSVRGTLAPSLDGREFTLSEESTEPCQLCGNLHDAGASVAVRTAEPDPNAPVFGRVEVSGRLEIDATVRPGLRLTAARIQAL